MEEYPQSNSYQIEASMESNNDSQTTQYLKSNSYQNESGKESNYDSQIQIQQQYPQSNSYQKKSVMASNEDFQNLAQYPQSNSYQNESVMESKNYSSGILNQYLTSDDFKFQYGIESKFICEFCYKEKGTKYLYIFTFLTQEQLDKHLLRRHQDTKCIYYGTTMSQKCHKCDKNFADMSSLNAHIEMIHTVEPKINEDQSKLIEEDKNKSMKNENVMTFYQKNGKTIYGFVNESDRDDKFVCDICHKRYTTEKLLDIHTKTIHAKIQEKEKKKREHKCNSCGKSFYQLEQLKKHHNEHQCEKNPKCVTCDKVFSNAKSFRYHINVYHGKTITEDFSNSTQNEQVDIVTANDGIDKVSTICTTEGFTKGSTEGSTEVFTEFSTEISTEGSSEIFTEASTEVSTKAPTEISTEGSTEASKENNKPSPQSSWTFYKKNGKTYYGFVSEADRDDKFLCEICKTRFITEVSLSRHKSKTHRIHESIKCRRCGKCYSSSSGYNSFLKKHICESSKVDSTEVSTKVPTEGSTEVPTEDFTEDFKVVEVGSGSKTIHICHSCGNSFNTAKYLIQHKKMVHGENWELKIGKKECKICEKSFHNKQGLQNHVKYVHLNHKYKYKDKKCNICGISQKNLNQHIRNVHENKKKCDICEKSFSRKDLKKHISAIHEGCKDYKCDTCDKQFSSARDLTSHIHKIHEQSKDYKGNTRHKRAKLKHECSICGKSFGQLNSLKTHISIVHEGRKNNKCKYCRKCFSDAKDLMSHIQTIHDLKCKFCGKSFSQTEYLKTHINAVHEGANSNNRCESCGKLFSRACVLKKHIHTVHEGHKDHKCESCGESFSQVGDLEKHVHTIHESRKDFKCESCDKSFSSASKLRHHTRENKCDPSFELPGGSTNSNKKLKKSIEIWINNCHKCEKTFTSAGYLKKHILTVHEGQNGKKDPKKIKCDICQEIFKNTCDLKDHMISIHPINLNQLKRDVIQLMVPKGLNSDSSRNELITKDIKMESELEMKDENEIKIELDPI